MPNQNESNQALQNLILMNRKKIEIKKVWENASPGSDFSEQTIELNVTDASFILVAFKVTKNSSLWGGSDTNVRWQFIHYRRPIQYRLYEQWHSHRNRF